MAQAALSKFSSETEQIFKEFCIFWVLQLHITCLLFSLTLRIGSFPYLSSDLICSSFFKFLTFAITTSSAYAKRWVSLNGTSKVSPDRSGSLCPALC